LSNKDEKRDEIEWMAMTMSLKRTLPLHSTMKEGVVFGAYLPEKRGSFSGGKGPNHPKEKTQRTWLSNEMSGTQTMPTVIGISIFCVFFFVVFPVFERI